MTKKILSVVCFLMASGLMLLSQRSQQMWLNRPATPLYLTWNTNQTFGANQNNFTGYVGAVLVMPSSDTGVTIHLVALGRWVVSGNSQTHIVALSNSVAGGTLVASAVVNTAGATPGTYAYTYLSTPIQLIYTAGNSWSLQSHETSGGDAFGDITTKYFPNTELFAVTSGAVNGSVNSGTTTSNAYGPLNFLYTIP